MTRISKVKIRSAFIALVVSLSLLSVGFLVGKYHGTAFNPPVDIRILGQREKHQEIDFSLFWQVLDILKEKYLFRNLDSKKILWGAISGMVEAAGDPYTSFLTPENNEAVKDSLNGTYQGIGAELGMEEEQIIVVSPLDGSPAKEAGFRPKDKILKINEQTTAGMSIIEAVSKIRGEKDTKVKLILQRDDESPFEVELTRREINVPSVELKVYEDKAAAYIRLSRFGDDTNKRWDEVSKQIQNKGLNNVIIDVRGNPGGYLLSSIHIAEDFLSKGDAIIWQEDPNGRRQAVRSERLGQLKGAKVVVLIDEGSASASEIVAGALRDNIGVSLVGKKSFGKGTVQDAQDFSDGSGLHVTVAKWLTPKGVWVHEKGLEPDVVVDLDEEKYKQGEDTQLERALEIF